MKHRFGSVTDVRLPNICLSPKHILVYFPIILEALYQSAVCSSVARGAVGGDLGEVKVGYHCHCPRFSTG